MVARTNYSCHRGQNSHYLSPDCSLLSLSPKSGAGHSALASHGFHKRTERRVPTATLWKLLVVHASQTLIFADTTGPSRAGSLIALAACRSPPRSSGLSATKSRHSKPFGGFLRAIPAPSSY